MQLDISLQKCQEQEDVSLEMRNASNTMQTEYKHSIELNQEK